MIEIPKTLISSRDHYVHFSMVFWSSMNVIKLFIFPEILKNDLNIFFFERERERKTRGRFAKTAS